MTGSSARRKCSRHWFNLYMKFFNRTLVFDFGSSTTVVCENDEVVFNEPTAIAIWPNGRAVIGYKAFMCYSVLPQDQFKPIVAGRVEHHEAFEAYVKVLVKKLVRFPRLCLKTVVLAIPDDMLKDENTEECDKAFFEPFRKLGVKEFKVVPHSIAGFVACCAE